MATFVYSIYKYYFSLTLTLLTPGVGGGQFLTVQPPSTPMHAIANVLFVF